MVAFDYERSAAGRAGRACVQKRVPLALEQAFLDGVKALFGLLKRQAQMRKAAVVFLQGDDIGDGFFLAIIITQNALQFDAHGGPLRVRVVHEWCTSFYRSAASIPSISMLSSPATCLRWRLSQNPAAIHCSGAQRGAGRLSAAWTGSLG